jgi:replication-associated recombination protein RarA
MLPADTNAFFDEYEQDVDEIVAACNGDLRAALTALMFLNEQLEQKLQLISAELTDRLPQNCLSQRLLH